MTLSCQQVVSACPIAEGSRNLPVERVIRSKAVTLSSPLMSEDSSIERLKAQLRHEISALSSGDRLASARTLMERFRVSPVTVSRAFADLVAEGLVVSRPGAGTFVAPRDRTTRRVADLGWQTIVLGDRTIDTEGLPPLVDPPDADATISLATGYLHSSLMPLAGLNAALRRAARLPNAWERPPAGGLRALRAWFARLVGCDVDAGNVVITPGGQGAISACFRALVPAGSPLLVESPTYPGALAVARAAGIRPVPVPTDANGVVPELLSEAFGRSGAQALYCQPLFHNPTGNVLAGERRKTILAAAAAAGAFVIEDDFARCLSHGRRPLPPLLADDEEGRVVYVTSLTKVASPSLRVGAVIARGPVAQRLQALRTVDDMFVPALMQEVALDLVSRPMWERHRRELARSLGRRAAVLAQAIATWLPAAEVTPPSGGMHLWAGLPVPMDDRAAADAARRAGVVVLAGRHFFPAEPTGPYLRLTYTAARTETELVEGVRRLAGALDRLG